MTIHHGTAVASARVRRIICLAHEAHEIEDRNARLLHALTGMCGVVGADVGAMFVFGSHDASVPQAGLIHGYSTSQTQAVLSEYSTQSVDFDLMAERLRTKFQGGEQVLARRRQDLLDNRTWYNSSFVNDARRRWGVDHCIYSLQRTGTLVLGMGLNRHFGAAAFRGEDQALVEIFHLATAKVISTSINERAEAINCASRARLAPRARATLDRLVSGAANKEIAEQLRLSPNTVHHYCKVIFRTFGVKSRSELLAKWFSDR